MRSFHLLGLALLVVALSACKPDSADNTSKSTESNPPTTTSAKPAKEKSDGMFGGIFSDDAKSAPLDLGEFKLLAITLGTALDSDNLVATPKTQFGARDKIYASVLSAGKHPGLTIKARWTAPDGNLVAETEQALVPTGGTVSTFSIDNEQPWPTGAYTLAISLNGVVQNTVNFEIK